VYNIQLITNRQTSSLIKIAAQRFGMTVNETDRGHKGHETVLIDDIIGEEQLQAMKNRTGDIKPSARLLSVTGSRLKQRQFFAYYDLPHVPYTVITSTSDIIAAVNQYPVYLKPIEWNGKTMVLQSPADLTLYSGVPSLLEVYDGHQKEFRLTIVRYRSGYIEHYEPVQVIRGSTHSRIELFITASHLDPAIILKACRYATQLSDILEHVGMLTLSFLLTPGGKILLDYYSPFTDESHVLTQYVATTPVAEQYIRAVSDLQPGDTSNHAAAAMVNIYQSEHILSLENMGHLLSMNDVCVHWYHHVSDEGLLGHIVVKDSSMENALSRTAIIRHYLRQNSGENTVLTHNNANEA